MVVKKTSGNDPLNGNRTRAFWLLSIFVMAVIIIIDVMEWYDPCLMVYGSVVFFALICSAFFSIWWYIKGSATSIFKWLTILLLALVYNDTINFVARYMHNCNPAGFDSFTDTRWWAYRSVPKLIAMIYLMTFAIWQRFGKHSTYHDGLRQDMADGFKELDARIAAGELRFEGHSHDGLVLGAKIILKPKGQGEKDKV